MKKHWLLITVLVLAALGVIGFLLVPQTTAPKNVSEKSGLIRVESPSIGGLLVSPATITGEARGTWYFEASFPVVLLDAKGKELARQPAQAQSDWMTTDFVPFSVTLKFSAPTTETGTLVLKKDNPSGLPERDDELRVPVRFR